MEFLDLPMPCRLHFHARIQRGWLGSDPLKNHKNIGFLSNTGADPLNNYKVIQTTFNVGQWPAYSENWVLSLTKRKKKTLSKLDPSDKTFRIRT